MPLTIVAQFRARPGQAPALEQRLRALVAPTREEDGCEVYELHRSIESEGFFHFHEIWTTRAHWQAHMRSAHLESFARGADEVVAERVIFELERVL